LLILNTFAYTSTAIAKLIKTKNLYFFINLITASFYSTVVGLFCL
jgi:hypothetical protein